MEGSSSSSSSSSSSAIFYDFLDRVRDPASLDLVRSIKSFIVSLSFYAANPEGDGKKVQEFYAKMEDIIRDHPLWAGATDEEVDCAMEGLEKYVMTKLFSRTFASSPEDAKIDLETSHKIHLLQIFLKPEHLDIPVVLRNEASWLEVLITAGTAFLLSAYLVPFSYANTMFCILFVILDLVFIVTRLFYYLCFTKRCSRGHYISR